MVINYTFFIEIYSRLIALFAADQTQGLTARHKVFMHSPIHYFES